MVAIGRVDKWQYLLVFTMDVSGGVVWLGVGEQVHANRSKRSSLGEGASVGSLLVGSDNYNNLIG